ncbi:hypothetical protein PGSY75_1310800 [Plasmodium gaboni]|uniref:Uncharacterized protein n=1 Tax=Plasmodium gaboni TaxID=647221 RepID=A0A151LD97_9APIC|nr:hypothetical protein PGSY75_1310800 [Plasmodium gaboni]KYN96909.1 hypothetical protein PGSY75_1310800 [Plasmodium gaboni]
MSEEKLQEIFWSVEELIYLHYQNEDIYEIKKKEILESLSILYNNNNKDDFKNANELLISEVEEENKLKNIFFEKMIEEFIDLFNVIKLIKNGNHKKCIMHPFIQNIFNYIKDIFNNKCIDNIEDIKKEIYNYIFIEKKKYQEMKYDSSSSNNNNNNNNKNNIFLHTCYIFLYEIKILLCCYIFLNIFVQYNWTGPPLNYDIKDIDNNDEEDIYFKEFIHAIHIKNNRKILNSCLIFLTLEGEEIYEYCELINAFSLSVIFLGLVNNYNNKTDNNIFSFCEYDHFKRYEHNEDMNKSMNTHDDNENINHTNGVIYTYDVDNMKKVDEKENNNINNNNNNMNHMKKKNFYNCNKLYDHLKLLYFVRSKYLWRARIFFIWQRLFTSSNDYYYCLKINIIDKPIQIFKNIKILPPDFELIEQDVNINEIYDILYSVKENLKDVKYCNLFYNNHMSKQFKIYVLSNFSIYLAFYNYTSAYQKILDLLTQISHFQYFFTGRMGIKRMYQKIPATILVLKTKLDDQEDNTSTILKEIEPLSEYDILKSDYRIIDNDEHNVNISNNNQHLNIKINDNNNNDKGTNIFNEHNESLKREDINLLSNNNNNLNNDQYEQLSHEKNPQGDLKDTHTCNNELEDKQILNGCYTNNINNHKINQNNDNSNNNFELCDHDSSNEIIQEKKYIYEFKDEKMINIGEDYVIKNKKNDNKTNDNIDNILEDHSKDENKESLKNYIDVEKNKSKITWKLKDFDPDTDILEEPHFVDSQNNIFKVLSFQEQICLINYCFSMIRFNPHYDEIKFEKLNAVISRCLKCYDVNPKNPHLIKDKNDNQNNNSTKNILCSNNTKNILCSNNTKNILCSSSTNISSNMNNNFSNYCSSYGDQKYVSLQLKYQNWLLHSCMLWFKCKGETFRFKTVDRAAAQLNELHKECYDIIPESVERLKFIYDVYYPTTWEMKKEIGSVMIKIGSVVTAFNIFKDLKLWEEAISCLIQADRKEEARELLDDLLKKKKSPCLLCLYGLIEKQRALNYYIEAWEVSNFKYAKAARLIGKYYYEKEMYEKCSEYLEKALELSPLFPEIWFILGCSYMKIENFDESIKAFTRMISMTNDNSCKSYGNLAYLYMKKGTYKAAKICINQAVKVNNNEWKYWDTYLKLSILQNDIDSFCLALRMICQVNQVKQIQPWVFDYISDVIVKDKPTLIQNKNGLAYLDKIITTMEHLSQYITELDTFWNAYSFFLFIKGKFLDSFEAKIKEIRSIESIIQKCNNEKLVDALISKIVVATKFLYHLINSHDVGEKKGTCLYQLKSLVESTLNHYKNLSSENLQELSQIKNILN